MLCYHRRERSTRMAVGALCLVFFSLVSFAAPLPQQSSNSFQEFADELASRIAAEVGSAARVALNVMPPAEDERASVPLEAEIRRMLTMKGIRIVERADGVATAEIGCARNLRERVCVCQMRRGDSRNVIVVTRPLEPRDERPFALSLALIPVFSQRAPILDVTLTADRLFVLDPERLTLYVRAEPERQASSDRGRGEHDAGFDRNRWMPLQSRPIGGARPWPRDVRGTLRVERDTVTAWLPGLICRGSADLARIACADERGTAWPIGIENTGIDAVRNHFATPEGLPFYSAAALDRETDGRWLIAADSGELMWLDAARRPLSAGASGDAVAGIDTSCGTGLYVLVASAGNNDGTAELLRLSRIVNRRLVPAAAAVSLPGRLTALWSVPGATLATAVIQDATAGRYEAFHVRVVCSG
jgi:hypothetical protein